MPETDRAGTGRRYGRVRTLWLGMRCDFTRAALDGALEGGRILPVAIVVPRGPHPRNAGWPEPPFDRWLRERDIAIIEVDRLAGPGLDTVLAAVDDLAIDIGVGACVPWKVPAVLRERLPRGVLNVHPSLLPALRGPEPVFHAYRLGLATTGVTVHLMDDGWDSGPVLARTRVPLPDTGSAAAFEAELARLGGRLLSDVAERWRRRAIAPEPQDATSATWAPVLDDADRLISASLTVAQAARFVGACAPLLAVDADTGRPVPVTGEAGVDGRHTTGVRTGHGAIRVALRDGDLWLRRGPQRAIEHDERRQFDRSS